MLIPYYRTTKRFFRRPSEGKAMYINASGTGIVDHKPKELGETLIIPTAKYESNPRPVVGEDDPNGLEGRCRAFCIAEFKATEGQLLEAMQTSFQETHGEGGVVVLVQGARDFSRLTEEGLTGTYEFGVAVLSWMPEELAGIENSNYETVVPAESEEIPEDKTQPPHEEVAPTPKGWFCESFSGGAEVYRMINDRMVEQPITDRDSLKVGDVVACPTLFHGAIKATVEKVGDGLIASDGKQAGWLTFGADSRNCWTCSGTMNLKHIRPVADPTL